MLVDRSGCAVAYRALAMRTTLRVLALAALATGASCVSTEVWRVDEPPLVAADVEGAGPVRVLTSAGQLLELKEVRWIGDPRGPRIAGQIAAPSERAGESIELRVDEVSRVETRRVDLGRVSLNVLMGLGVVFLCIAGLIVIVGSSGGFLP